MEEGPVTSGPKKQCGTEFLSFLFASYTPDLELKKPETQKWQQAHFLLPDTFTSEFYQPFKEHQSFSSFSKNLKRREPFLTHSMRAMLALP